MKNRIEEFQSMIRTVPATATTRLGLVIDGKLIKLTVVDNKPRSMPLDAAELCDFIVEYHLNGGLTFVKVRGDMDAEEKQSIAFTINAYAQDYGQVRWASLTERLAARVEPDDIADASPAEQARAAAEVLPPVTRIAMKNGGDDDWTDGLLHDEDCPVCHPHLHPDEQE
jgi:hypothetical protein